MRIYIDAACLPLSSDSFPASLLHPNPSPLIYFIPYQGWGSSLGSGHIPGSEPSPRTASQNMLTICYQIKCKGELVKFTHPQVFPNLYECVCSAEHKGRYSVECGKQSISGAPLTSIVFFFSLWKSMVPQNCLVTNFLQNIFLCVRQNKDIHTGLEILGE